MQADTQKMEVGVDLAQAHVLRKLVKEKMKEEVEERGTIESKANRSSGCFVWFSKKPRRTSQIRDINEKELRGDHLDPNLKTH